MSRNPFDYVNDITDGKKDIIRHDEMPEVAEQQYTPFLVNRALSYFPDTIMYAEEMNAASHLSHIMQYDYLLNTIRKKKRFSSWFKREKQENVDLVQRYYNVNRQIALQYLELLNDQQLDEIRKRTNVE